jgi:hypothetical protein
MLSTSEEEMEEDAETSAQPPNTTDWQVQRLKRRKLNATKQYNNKVASELPTSNRYQVLTNNTQNEPEKNVGTTGEITPKPHAKPPPIFVYDVFNYPKMIEQLTEVAEEEQYNTKSLANNVVKINCNTPDTYRRMITYMREHNVMYHSYQTKEDRAFRVVIKYLHPSIQTEAIATELSQYGHKVRNITNARHHRTKESLNIFFADLEPSDNNKEVYNIDRLQNKLIRIEPPRKFNTVIQCTRCQLYGHSKTYCNRPFLCVKCGGPHNSTTCKKSNNTPATCGLCGGSHPANYKGCEYYRNIKRNKVITHKPMNQQQVRTPQTDCNGIPPMQAITPHGHPVNNHLDNRSYAEATKNTPKYHYTQPLPADNNPIPLINFLDEFKQMFHQLIQQNSTILNMLTALIHKLK